MALTPIDQVQDIDSLLDWDTLSSGSSLPGRPQVPYRSSMQLIEVLVFPLKEGRIK